MKRLIALLLTLLLLLSATGSASAAKMVQTFENDYFKIYIPGDWVIDLSSVADYYGMLDLGFAYSADKTMLLESYMNFYSDWAEDSLWTGSKELWEEYEEFILVDLEEENPVILEKVYADKYPGVLVRGTNAYGDYLLGEFMINAYAYTFYFYLLNEDDSVNSDIQPDDIELFQSILETFAPKLIGYTN